MTAAGMEVKHGYTLRDLDQMTRAAVIADRSAAADIETRKSLALSAIGEALAEATETPDRQDLIRVGWQAIYRDARTAYRQRGRPDEAWDDYEYTSTPRFSMFWRDRQVSQSHEHRFVEELAAVQVVKTLTPIYRDAILALAAFDDYRLAAKSLGLKDNAFRERVRVARRQMLAWWFQGETPHRIQGTDRRVGVHGTELATHCKNGHEWTSENTRIRHRILRGKRHTSRVCRTCDGWAAA